MVGDARCRREATATALRWPGTGPKPTRPWGACNVHRRVVETKNARCRQPRAREASGGLGRRAARSGRRRRDLNRATRRKRKLGRYSLNHEARKEFGKEDHDDGNDGAGYRVPRGRLLHGGDGEKCRSVRANIANCFTSSLALSDRALTRSIH